MIPSVSAECTTRVNPMLAQKDNSCRMVVCVGHTYWFLASAQTPAPTGDLGPTRFAMRTAKSISRSFHIPRLTL